MSMIFFLIFTIAPVTIDGQGIIHEPFYLIGLGYFMLLLSFIFLIFFGRKSS
jgi:hypothetical protein